MKFSSPILNRILLFLMITGSLQAQVVIPNKDISGSAVQSLNGTWKFKYIPSVSIGEDSLFYKHDYNFGDWKAIKVPGHWELQGFAEPKYGNVDAGTGLYRTTFNVPENWRSKQLFIVFDGVQYGYDLWVNGHYTGTWGSSYNRQMFDISNFCVIGKVNSLAVKVTTRNKGYEFDTNDCWALSGIIRDVTLIGVPQTHLKDVTVKTYVGQGAKIDISVLLEKSLNSTLTNKLALTGKLFSPQGKMVTEFNSGDLNILNADTVRFNHHLNIENPQLWTAETPSLYRLELMLKSEGKVLQQIYHKVGIRQVGIQNGILKLNGQAIKLRGVDHHDLNPLVGRALTNQMILKDLVMMKQANINFIRTSHYPSHPKMIELCDSLGIYVLCEVPFGYGDKNLKDSTFLEVLVKRAKATVERDKNHPSVIAWSIGNENQMAPIAMQTGQYVKKIDNTRPVCYPQVGSYFATIYKTIPGFIDILAPHYGNAETLEKYAHQFNRPLIATEYAHALGLDFDKMETMWEVMYRHPSLAGGAVWHFHDQGILRLADKKVDVNAFTYSVWADSIHYYDNFGNKGADGLVYANRIPQVDYWQVRKVYTPVKALNDSIIINPGKQVIRLRINNRYDFTDLSEVTCKWTLTADNRSIETGAFAMKCAPHDTVSIPVALTLPPKLTSGFYLLNLKFYDKLHYQFTEKTYRLWNANSLEIKNNDLVLNPMVNLVTGDNGFSYTFNFGKTLFSIGKQQGNLKIENAERKQLLLEGPFARVGRKTTMSILTLRLKDSTGVSTNWNPPVLKNPVATVNSVSANVVQCNYKYERADKKGEFIQGSVIYTVSKGGWIDVKYNFTPVNTSAFFLEAGISFLVPNDFTEFRWIGNGPYPSYPGKSMLDEFGFYHMNSSDINYQGNRSEVQLATMTDKNGNGFAINCKNANIAVERTPEGLLLSHNALVSGRYNKNSEPDNLYKTREVKTITGNFSIVPINGKQPAPMFLQLFGNLNTRAVPFKPFYHSYDQ